MTKLKCPYCQQPIYGGAVTIKGERYYCSHCVVWFKMKNDKLIKAKFVEIT